MELVKEKSTFSCLYATSKNKDINEIYQTIKNNKIDCNYEFLDKTQIIKDLFLTKIKDNMTYDTYVNYKEALKKLKPSQTEMYIDNLINILKLSDKEILEIIYKELVNKNYVSLTSSRKNNDIIINSSSIIDVLVEINSNINQFIGKYIWNIIKDKSKEERIQIYNERDKELDIYKVIIKEIYIDKFGYLDNGIFKDIYNKYLSEIENLFIERFKREIYRIKEENLSYEKFPSTSGKYGGVENYGYYSKK